jgi:predicted GNAT family acetyltransferase
VASTSTEATGDSRDPEVRHLPGHHRYEIWVDDARAGLTVYEAEGGSIAFMHTKIGDEYAGRGLGSILISAALDDVRASGRSVLPFCPFVRAYLQRHHEYADLVPPSRHAEFGLPADPD